VMIEVPALLWDLDRLFERVDFASVGTNDLFQFINASDRNNPKTDRRYEILKPVNLRILSSIAAAAKRLNKPVSVCGELAGQPLGAIALVGCGFRSLSMNTACLARIKETLCALDVGLVEQRIQALSHSAGGNLREEIAELAQEFGVALH